MKIPIPVDEVLRRLGRKGKMEVSPQLARLVNEEISICQDLMTPMGIYDRFGLSLDRSGAVSISGGFTVNSSDLYRWVRGCDELVVMVVTVGPGINERVQELTEAGEVTRGMIVDAIGSETVEELAGVLNRIIANTARKAVTKRYSPGYGDWDLTDQKSLLELIGAGEIGVTVSDSSQMIPEKSISAVIGLRDRAVTTS
jgi:hypothetical protein